MQPPRRQFLSSSPAVHPQNAFPNVSIIALGLHRCFFVGIFIGLFYGNTLHPGGCAASYQLGQAVGLMRINQRWEGGRLATSHCGYIRSQCCFRSPAGSQSLFSTGARQCCLNSSNARRNYRLTSPRPPASTNGHSRRPLVMSCYFPRPSTRFPAFPTFSPGGIPAFSRGDGLQSSEKKAPNRKGL